MFCVSDIFLFLKICISQSISRVQEPPTIPKPFLPSRITAMCPPTTPEQCSLSVLPTSIRREGGEKSITSQKAPFPNPHKLHITWLQWDDYTLLARILWRLLTEPHYVDAHLWLNVSTSFLFSPAWPASHYCSWGERWETGGQEADQDSLRLGDSALRRTFWANLRTVVLEIEVILTKSYVYCHLLLQVDMDKHVHGEPRKSLR